MWPRPQKVQTESDKPSRRPGERTRSRLQRSRIRQRVHERTHKAPKIIKHSLRRKKHNLYNQYVFKLIYLIILTCKQYSYQITYVREIYKNENPRERTHTATNVLLESTRPRPGNRAGKLTSSKK